MAEIDRDTLPTVAEGRAPPGTPPEALQARAPKLWRSTRKCLWPAPGRRSRLWMSKGYDRAVRRDYRQPGPRPRRTFRGGVTKADIARINSLGKPGNIFSQPDLLSNAAPDQERKYDQ